MFKEFEEYRSKRLADWAKQKSERMAIRKRKYIGGHYSTKNPKRNYFIIETIQTFFNSIYY